MTARTELKKIYIRGFKQLFYLSGEKGARERLSFLKIFLFIIYLLAFVFAFLQFTEINISEGVIQEYQTNANFDNMFPVSIYGELALLMNYIIFMGFFYFLVTRDKPLNEVVQQFKDLYTRSRYHALALTIGLTIGLIFIGYQIVEIIYSPFTIINASYTSGKGLFIAWVVLQPILVFSALLVLLDILTKDYPKLVTGYNKKNVSIFTLSVVVAIAIIGIVSIVFNINIESGENDTAPPFKIEGLEEIEFYEIGIWWLINGINIVLVAMVILIVSEIIIGKKRGSNEIQERRKGIFLLLFPFTMVYVIIKALPVAFTFTETRLKSINNIIDIVSLAIVITLGIFRVLTIQESETQQPIKGKDWFNPKEWLDLIPPYCKALALFFLAFGSFYASIEATAIAELYGVQNWFRLIRLRTTIGMTFVAICIVFWRYKPIAEMMTPGPGSIKTFTQETKKKIRKIIDDKKNRRTEQ
jgi:hypothetical protein